MRIPIIAAFVLFLFAPAASAASLTVLDYSQCSHFLGLVSCNQQTEVCATNTNTGLPGCFLKSQAANYVDHTTQYPNLATCTQQSNCPYACTANNLAIPTTYFCSNSPATVPAQTSPTTQVKLTPAPTTQVKLTPATNGTSKIIKLVNPLGEGTTLMSFLLSILSIITDTVGPVIVILMLVYVGFKFVTAQGKPTEIEAAKGMFLWVIVGALILLGAKVIAMGIQATVQSLSSG